MSRLVYGRSQTYIRATFQTRDLHVSWSGTLRVSTISILPRRRRMWSPPQRPFRSPRAARCEVGYTCNRAGAKRKLICSPRLDITKKKRDIDRDLRSFLVVCLLVSMPMSNKPLSPGLCLVADAVILLPSNGDPDCRAMESFKTQSQGPPDRLSSIPKKEKEERKKLTTRPGLLVRIL